MNLHTALAIGQPEPVRLRVPNPLGASAALGVGLLLALGSNCACAAALGGLAGSAGTAPAASRRLSQLEHQFKATLFERHSRGLQLTPAGAHTAWPDTERARRSPPQAAIRALSTGALGWHTASMLTSS